MLTCKPGAASLFQAVIKAECIATMMHWNSRRVEHADLSISWWCSHAPRLWRQMLLSLKQALLDSCPAAMTQDVLGKALQLAAHCIAAKYSRLQPSEQWQARLAADVWHIAETCQTMSQPIEAEGR